MGKHKQKRKLTVAEKAAKRKRKEEYMTIFVGGKQKRVKRPPTIDDEFIRINADPIWLTQEEMWEEMHACETARDEALSKSGEDKADSDPIPSDDDSDIPF